MRALVFYLGGTAPGSKLVVGPDARPDDAVIPLIHALAGAREALALGTLLPNEHGETDVHMHAATGREGDATVGCTRAGLETWLVGEVVLLEILGTERPSRDRCRHRFRAADAMMKRQRWNARPSERQTFPPEEVSRCFEAENDVC